MPIQSPFLISPTRRISYLSRVFVIFPLIFQFSREMLYARWTNNQAHFWFPLFRFTFSRSKHKAMDSKLGPWTKNNESVFNPLRLIVLQSWTKYSAIRTTLQTRYFATQFNSAYGTNITTQRRPPRTKCIERLNVVYRNNVRLSFVINKLAYDAIRYDFVRMLLRRITW